MRVRPMLRTCALLCVACCWPAVFCALAGQWLGALGWALLAFLVGGILCLVLSACADAQRRHTADASPAAEAALSLMLAAAQAKRQQQEWRS